MGTGKSTRVVRLDYRRAATILASGFITLLFFKNASAAAEFVSRGIFLCAQRLIPSLFPFLVVSSLLISSGLDGAIGKTLGRPIAAIFGISGEGACAVLLGFLCGFPVGARCACELLDAQKTDHAECQRILTVCSVPSPAFLISVVGGGLFSDFSVGWRLYAVCIFCAVSVGVLLRFVSPLPIRPKPTQAAKRKRASFAAALTSAVYDGAKSMLCVCAFVIFFSSFLGALESVLAPLGIGETASALLFSFFELTSGISRASLLSAPLKYSLSLCALAAGWSGLSVHFQTMAICAERRLSFTPFILSHALRGALGALIALVIF